MGQLPYSRQSISDDDVAAVARALRGDWLTQGPMVGQFERSFAKKVGADECVAVSSGTAALQLAYAALGLGPGDELITSPITFSATANAARRLGAEIVFADIDPATGNILASSVLEQVSERTRGIAAIHYGGLPADLRALSDVAKSRDLFLVEDACHALGASYRGSTIGDCRYSDAAVFSTHAIKNITTAEGGMVSTNSVSVADRCRLLRNHGIDKTAGDPSEPWSYDMLELGWNYRLSDIQCALGLSQLGRLDQMLAKREELSAAYVESLAVLFGDAINVQPSSAELRNGRHLLSVQIDFEAFDVSRSNLMVALKADGIGTQVNYIPVHTLRYYLERYGQQEIPNAQAYFQKQLSLPLFVEMSAEDVTSVTSALDRHLTARKHHRARLQSA